MKMTHALVEDYTVEVYTLPCDSAAESLGSIAHLTTDISQVLPLLNASLPGAVYYPYADALTWKQGGLNVAFHPYQIAIASVDDRQAAADKLAEMVDLVNRIWSRRDEITPDFEKHQRPVPMTIYRLLPRTNCRSCGEPSCFTFALKLAAGERQLDDCSPLLEPARAEHLSTLRNLVRHAPNSSA
jgi:ArsR family metal-binding transcriptional regulator